LCAGVAAPVERVGAEEIQQMDHLPVATFLPTTATCLRWEGHPDMAIP
jgi:hypothetical protein